MTDLNSRLTRPRFNLAPRGARKDAEMAKKAKKKREFRSKESYAAEATTRDLIRPLLESRGFNVQKDDRKFHGKVVSQTVTATSPSGERLSMRVRLCWRRRGANDTKSAAQLLSKVKNGDWIGSIQHMIDNEQADGVTHLLLPQREESATFSRAALIPLDALIAIWTQERDASAKLAKKGRRTKNHAMNGSSPTIWLFDPKEPTVSDPLWRHPGVIDVVALPVTEPAIASADNDDTFDDLPMPDVAELGTDGAPVTRTMRSAVKRDRRVRQTVLQLAGGACERTTCRRPAEYPSFLDVHHIFGADRSDRVWTCVALCPNCHRDAHLAPNMAEINAELLVVAEQRRPA